MTNYQLNAPDPHARRRNTIRGGQWRRFQDKAADSEAKLPPPKRVDLIEHGRAMRSKAKEN